MPPRKKSRAGSQSWVDDLEGLTERAPKLDRSDLIARAESISDEQLVEVTELPALRRLALAVFEGPGQLPAAQRAIVSAGHAVARAGTGRAGLEDIRALIVNGAVDALLVALPGGEALIDAALALERRPVIVASFAGDAPDAVRHAAAAGADLVAMRPHDVDRLAPILLAATRLADERHGSAHATAGDTVMRARLEQLANNEPNALQPFALFQKVLELELRRARRYAYPLAVALFAVEVPPPPAPAGLSGLLRARAGTALIHAIRDIDLATELDHDRFLVLLPYTELTGATEVARRVVAAVAAQDPISSAGRRYPPRVTGAVAGVRPDQPLSFARLMKDATRALEQARREGKDLVVQP